MSEDKDWRWRAWPCGDWEEDEALCEYGPPDRKGDGLATRAGMDWFRCTSMFAAEHAAALLNDRDDALALAKSKLGISARGTG